MSVVPGIYNLPTGQFEPEIFSMVAVAPRPDSETGDFQNGNVRARYRWAYFNSVNPIRYEFALKIFGGSPPHIFELLTGPSGMTVGNDRNPADHGVVKWTPTQSYSASSPAVVRVRVHGQDGNTLDLEWTIQTSSSTDRFMFLDADNGDDSTGDGSITSPFKTLFKFTGEVTGSVTYPDRIVYLRGSTANYETVAHTNAWRPRSKDVIPARIHLDNQRHPTAFVAFPDEDVVVDFTNAQILTKAGDSDFFLSGSSTSPIKILGSADNAAETHNFWFETGHRGHLQWVNFDGFIPRVDDGYTNSVPVFMVSTTPTNRMYWSCHAISETNRTASSDNDSMLWIIFGMKYWADDYCFGHRGGTGPGVSFKDRCYQTSSRYQDISSNSGSFTFAFMGQSGSGDNELCYSKVEGPFWFNLQAGPNVGKMVEYRNTIRTVDTNHPYAVRAWKGANWTGPYLSINSVLMSNGPVVDPDVTATGTEAHSTNSNGNRSIDVATMTLQNAPGGTQYRDLYLFSRGNEIGGEGGGTDTGGTDTGGTDTGGTDTGGTDTGGDGGGPPVITVSNSKRLTTLKALTVLLEGITTAEGDSLSTKVWRGRNRPGDESVAPYINIFEMPPEFEERADTTVAWTPWVVGIQGYVKAGEVHLTDPAHEFMAEVKKALSVVLDNGGQHRPGPLFMFGGLINDMQVDGGMVFSPDETSDCAFFAMKLTINITENLENP